MTHNDIVHNGLRALTGIAAATALVAGLANSDIASAQGRNPGRGGDSSPQRSSPPPSQPSRSEPSRSEPQRSEPQRSEPRREAPRYEAPRREEPRREAPRYETPRREEPRYEYQRRPDINPSRESTPIPSRDPGRPSFGDDRRSGREASPINRQDPSVRRDEPRTPPRDSYQQPRRDDSAYPRRDQSPRTDPSSPARDGGYRYGDQRPQRDNGGSDRNTTNRPYDRMGERRTTDQGPRRDSYDRRDSGAGPIRSGDLGYRRDSRGENISPRREGARDIFTRSQEGRYYNNGVLLRRGYYSPYREIGHYYPNYVFYPYYYPTYDASLVYYSPYSFYFGVCAPYIYRRHTYYAYPSSVWIDVPIYVNNEYRGWDDDRQYRDDYYLNRSGYYDPDSVADSSLRDALDDIRDAFRYGSIEHLVNLVDPQIKIAVFLKGKYDYSMASNDYLDLTRDAMRNMDTIEFDLTRLRKRAMSVYVASGKHVYRDREGEKRTVYVSFVLENLRDRWTITQVGTSPDRIQEP